MRLSCSFPYWVSIQLVSPASGEDDALKVLQGMQDVSIQLVSPASGETAFMLFSSPQLYRFHSISFPSEWGVKTEKICYKSICVSIQLVSPASGEFLQKTYQKKKLINVSIQLVSPASGENLWLPARLSR